jgi:putative sporulation protein YtaF
MLTLYTLFIALANNLDNIGVRIAYSIRGIKINIAKNLWISVITFIISSLAAFSGSIASKLLNKNTASIISMVLLIGIGLWIIIEPYIHKVKIETDDIDSNSTNIYDILVNPEKADKDKSKDIDFKEATFLGIALSINDVGGGLSAGMIGLNFLFVGLFSATISFLALFAGNYITEFFKRWNLEKRATIFSGLILILIGIKQVL